MLGGNNLQYLLSALGQAGGAIGEVLGKTLNNERPTSTLFEGITVTSTIVGTAPRTDTYTVQQVVNTCNAGDDSAACMVDVDLTITILWPAFPTGAKTDAGLSLAAASGLRVTFTKAVLKNAYLSATVAAPTSATAGHVRFGNNFSFIMDSTVRATWESTTALQLDFSNMTMDLPLTLQQLGASNPVTATVALSGTGAAVEADVAILGRKSNDSAASTTTSRIKADVFALQSLAVDVKGEIKDSSESIKLNAFSLDMNGDKVAVDDPFDDLPPVPAYVLTVDTNRLCEAGSCKNKTVIDTEGETVAEYLTAMIGLDLSAALSGVDPVSIKATAERSSDELLSLDSFDLVAEGASLDMSADINLEGEMVSLEALNQAGLKLVITSNASGARSGTLVTASGVKVADVIEQDGKIIVNYVDGTSVVL